MAFGSYINNKSFVHNLNPSLKFLICIFLIILVFLPIGFFGQIFLIASTFILWALAKLPWRAVWNIGKSVIAMFLLLLLINWIAYKAPGFNPDITNCSNPIFTWISNIDYWNKMDAGGMCVSYTYPDGSSNIHFAIFGQIWGGEIHEQIFVYPGKLDPQNPFFIDGWKYISKKINIDGHDLTAYLFYKNAWYSLSSNVLTFAIYVSIKIFLMIMIVTLLVSTTSSIQLTFAIEDILSPLRIIKIPVNEWAMTISIAIRFVPSLLDESQKILRAQASRGVDFSNGNYKDKTKALVSLVVPMFSVAFNKADDLANAMESRSYNPRYARTRYRNFPIRIIDWITFLLFAVILGFFLTLAIKNNFFGPFGVVEALLIYG